jgi:hypothetical protein
MKRTIYNIAVICMLGILSMASCTKDFEEINTDPNAFTTVQPENQLAGVMKSTLDRVGGWMNDHMYMNYAHYYGGMGGQFERYYYTESGVISVWEDFYVNILTNLEEIIKSYGDNPDYANRVHMTKIWKSYVYSVMVSTFGGVPMSQAHTDVSSVAYDTEEQIYTSILNMLKEAGDNITTSGDKLGQDPLFNGDNELWIKFANSLRLKVALRISEGFPTLAETHAREVMGNEDMLISSNAENALLSWGPEEENWSFNYDGYIHDGRWESGLADIKMNHFFMLFMKTYKDPRMEAFANPSREPYKLVDSLYESGTSGPIVAVEYPIPYLGKPLASSSTLSDWDLPGDENPFAGVSDDSYSYINYDNFMVVDADFMILPYAEVNFMKAEAALKGWGGSKTAEQYYYDGIDASFDQWDIQGADTYKERDGVKWGTASTGDRNFNGIASSAIPDDPFTKIIVQRWIAMFNQGHDGWCLEKRTRAIRWPPHLNPEQTRNLDWSEIPERMIYATNEVALNEAAYLEAVSRLGGVDDVNVPIKMNKTLTPIDWNAYTGAEFNTEFGKQWYGNSIDDLIANGVEYTILSK